MHDVRTVDVREDILGENDRIAARLARDLAERGVFAVNVMGAPGIGKTTALLQLIERLEGVDGQVEGVDGLGGRLEGFRSFVIEGDIEGGIRSE
ncbi:MAG: hypothetical protein FWH32_06025, partial [Clostridiales bacterium]|nr:hypothetical protein [Clostridiales bacterium]